MKLLLVTLALLSSLMCFAQTPSRTPAPVLPGAASQSEKGNYTKAAQLVSRGAFDQAVGQLANQTPAATTKIWVDWSPVPKNLRAPYRDLIIASIAQWNKGLGGAVTFVPALKEEEADLLVFFERSVVDAKLGQTQLLCGDIELDAAGGHRTGRIHIALIAPNAGVPHSAASIAHVFQQELGAFLGLGQNVTNSAGVMAPDLHAGEPVSKLNEADIRDARQIVDARLKLLDFARRKVAVYLPQPKLIVDKMKIDAGDVWRGESAHYVFMVKNTGDAPLEIEAKPNCGCTVANYDKVIPPKGEGKIEADMHTNNFRGRVTKGIEIRSNDLDSPNVSVQLLANVKSILSVTPSETPVIGLKTGEPTTQELQIKIDSTDPVQLTRVACSASYAKVAYEPMPTAGSGTSYKVTLTIDPAAPMGRSAFVVTAFTSSKREPQMNITAVCEKGVIVMPPSAYMGAIGPQAVLPLNQFITVSRRDGNIHIQKIENDDPKLEIKQTTVKEGQQYQLQLIYKGGWPAGIVSRKIVIITDDPAQPRIEIPVVANVLAATPPGAGK